MDDFWGVKNLIENNGGIENFRCFAKMGKIEMATPFGFCLVSGDKETWTECKIDESRYTCRTYKIINYLLRKHSINCPIKTQGWINDKLIHVNITPEGMVGVRFLKSKNGKCSEKVFDCLYELVRIVRVEKSQED